VQEFYISTHYFQKMDPMNRKTKKRARTAVAGNRPATKLTKTILLDKYPSVGNEEDLIGYEEPEEQEEPTRFSPADTDYSAGNYDSPAHVDGPEDNEVVNDDFPANPAEGGHMAGAKRSQNVFQEEERSRKATRSVGIGSPLPEDIYSTTGDNRMSLATLPTGGRSNTRTFAALPMGGNKGAKSSLAAPPMGGSVSSGLYN
jgi:hypothetical protein